MQRRVLAAAILTALLCLTGVKIRSARADSVDFSAFADTWQRHSMSLTISPDGSAVLIACPILGTGGSCVTSMIQFTAVIGSTALGRFLSPTPTPDETLWFTLLPNDLGVLMDFSSADNYITSVSRLFCGSQAPPAAITALRSPCGA